MLTISKTATTPDASKYRGQRSVVLACLKELKGKAQLDTLVEHARKAGYKMPGPLGFSYAGGIRGSVLYHLNALAKAKEVELTGDAGKVARTPAVPEPKAKGAKKAKAAKVTPPTEIAPPAAEQAPAA